MTTKRKQTKAEVPDGAESFWNYRLIRYSGNCLKLAEVYWNRNSKGVPEIFMVNDRPSITGASLAAIQDVLKCINRDIKHEIIDEKDIPADEDAPAELVQENLESNHERNSAKQPKQIPLITWETMVQLEPRLGTLLEEIKNCQDLKLTKSFCANSVWAKKFKQKMIQLVGWEAKITDLSTDQAYDIAYNVLYGALPPCRSCGCL